MIYSNLSTLRYSSSFSENGCGQGIELIIIFVYVPYIRLEQRNWVVCNFVHEAPFRFLAFTLVCWTYANPLSQDNELISEDDGDTEDTTGNPDDGDFEQDYDGEVDDDLSDPEDEDQEVADVQDAADVQDTTDAKELTLNFTGEPSTRLVRNEAQTDSLETGQKADPTTDPAPLDCKDPKNRNSHCLEGGRKLPTM